MILQEGNTRIIVLSEEKPGLVHQMLSFFYRGDYNEMTGPLVSHASMYAIGDKYDSLVLRDYASNKFNATIDRFNTTMIPDLIESIQVIYETAPPGDTKLSNKLSPLIQRYKDELRQNEAFMKLVRSGFADGAFIVDVIDA